jgi:hypothetical protein
MTAITTLIPAFKPEHLGETLLGLRRQSFQDFRVIVSDDSPGAVITDMIRDRRFGAVTDGMHLTVVRGPGNARLNHQQLLDLWNGATPFVHLLMDDDVVFPSFYRSHLDAHAGADFGVSVSARWLSENDSRPAWSLPLPPVVASSPLRHVPLQAADVIGSVLPQCDNWLGELSNMLWSADAVPRYDAPPVGMLSYHGLLDIGPVLDSLHRRPLVFINDRLSVFRQHAGQNTRGIGSNSHRGAMLVWVAYALHAWRCQQIDAQDLSKAIGITVKRCLNLYGETDPVMNDFYALIQEEGGNLAGLHAAFTAFWLALLARQRGAAPVRAEPEALPA